VASRSFGPFPFNGTSREDGSIFVTSPNLPHFSAVLPDGEWEGVVNFLKMFIEANVGNVKSITVIHDASELIASHQGQAAFAPPPYVIAEVQNKNARTIGTRAR
jgi:hypothetical protein